MKSRILVIILTIVSATALRAAEVNFRPLTWEEAIKAATAEHKYIYVDAYTDWCYWCKVLDKNTFTNDTVAEFMNSHFVCVKYEMEHDFGAIFAMKYRVNSFPQQLMFRSDGTPVFRSSGYRPPAEFLKLLESSVNPKEQTDYKGITSRMDLPFPEFYKAVHLRDTSRKVKYPDSLELETYLNVQSDLFSEVNWSILHRFSLKNPKRNDFIVSNSKKYAELFGKENVDDKLFMIFYTRVVNAGEAGDAKAFQAVLTDVDHYYLADATPAKKQFKTMFYEKVKDWNSYLAMARDDLESQKFSDASAINSYCWTIYEKCDDPAIVTTATDWMKRGIDIEPNYANLDTYAALLFKCGRLDDAEREAKRAIEAGKKDKAEVKSTEELLKKIDAKRAAQ